MVPGSTRSVAAAVALLLVTACGSTVDSPTAVGGAATGGGGLSADAGTTGAAPSGAPGAQAVTGGVVAGGPSTATGSGGAAAAGTSGAAAPDGTSGTTTTTTADGKRVRLGPGVTATTVRLGMIYSPNLNDAQRATGNENLQTGDPLEQEKALIEEINRTGGFAGRKVVLDAYAISATTPDAEQAFNGACQHFTQDSKVFAVVTAGPESFSACLEKGGVLHVGSDLTAATSASTKLLPHALRPAGITMDDAARLVVSGLDQQGYFKDSVVGVITFDGTPYKNAVERVMKPALARIGHPSRKEFYVATPRGVSDYGSMSSSISSAVLQFRSAGVTHVIIFDQQGRITTFFIPAAQSQDYRPRYGFTSQAGFQVGVTSGSIPPEQARGAAGIGWLPAFDVPLARTAMTPGGRRCVDFFSKKGMPPSGENATVIAQFQCQDAWLLDTVMDRLTADVTRDAFVAIAETMGAVVSAANRSISFDRSRHDGVRVVRNVGWTESCGCFRYVGGDRGLT
jgi:hypothetical protein